MLSCDSAELRAAVREMHVLLTTVDIALSYMTVQKMLLQVKGTGISIAVLALCLLRIDTKFCSIAPPCNFLTCDGKVRYIGMYTAANLLDV